MCISDGKEKITLHLVRLLILYILICGAFHTPKLVKYSHSSSSESAQLEVSQLVLGAIVEESRSDIYDLKRNKPSSSVMYLILSIYLLVLQGNVLPDMFLIREHYLSQCIYIIRWKICIYLHKRDGKKKVHIHHKEQLAFGG